MNSSVFIYFSFIFFYMSSAYLNAEVVLEMISFNRKEGSKNQFNREIVLKSHGKVTLPRIKKNLKFPIFFAKLLI